MKKLTFVLFVLSVHSYFAQDDSSSFTKHRNYFGLSFGVGGKMETANDINTTTALEGLGGYAKP